MTKESFHEADLIFFFFEDSVSPFRFFSGLPSFADLGEGFSGAAGAFHFELSITISANGASDGSITVPEGRKRCLRR